jgi:hypothetical protein
LGGRFVGRPEKVTVGELLDDNIQNREDQRLWSLRTLKVHRRSEPTSAPGG